MKVIKRDGRVVDYDREKISIAIQKANKEVKPRERATKEDISSIMDYIEELDKKRILVEDIQDIIEEKLMELQKFELAKKYIVYRYTRALVRKQNTTDESILSLIKNSNKELMEENSNKNAVIASTQRDLIAGEVSKDLTKRMLLPEKISKAHEDGDIIIIEEAERFANSVRDSYQQLMSFDYIHNCFSRAKKLLNKPEYSFITNSYFIELKNFFEELALCEKGENWTVTPRLKEVSDKLATMTKKALIHLTRQGAVRNFSKEIEHFCEMIYIIEKFFEDIATSSGLFHCLLQKNERSQDTPAFRKVQVFYYPNRVDSIIADSLKNKKCSIVFTGKRIAGKDSEYSSLFEECGIEELGKPVVKEYILKQMEF